MSLNYTPQFWQRAFELASSGAKRCDKCRLWASRKSRERVTVRVVLAEDGHPMPHKLKLMCTRCFPGSRETTIPRKQILAKIAELPFPEPDKARTVNGR